uniref:Uncharacterized protein n=1 Tax=Meloidogyne hapla TaxID=6305 RepID=A0A1I8B6I7_MELHA
FSNVLSPSLFSLHNEGKGLEKELSLPKLLKSSKINGRDQQEWLNLIMEYSGVNQQIKEIKIQDIFGDYEERKTSTWEELNKRFNDKQRTDLNQIGYSMLSKDQLKFLYGPKSPFNDSLTLDRLLPLIDSLTINQLIEEDIKKISEMNSFNIRQHDVVLAPSAFRVGLLNPVRASQPFILSPFLFSPTVLSPTIFGVGILSPKLFSPTILSPRVMSPLILNPLMFSPIILSPIVMQPFILSPGLLHATANAFNKTTARSEPPTR